MCPAFSSNFSDLCEWAASILGQKYLKNVLNFYTIILYICEVSYDIGILIHNWRWDPWSWHITRLCTLYLWQFLKTELQTRRTQASYITENPVPTLKMMFAFPHSSQSWVSPNFLISTSLWWVTMVSFKLSSDVGISRKYFCCSWLLVTVLVSHTWVDRCTHICDMRESVYICVDFHKFA